MTSQALTVSARHTSSTAPTRLRRRHSLRDNEWCAIVRACVTEVRRPFLSHHSTRRSIALAVGDIPMGNLPLQAKHTMVRSGGTAGTRASNASLTDVSAHCVPPESRNPGRSLARPLHPLCCDPQPLANSADRPSSPATAMRGRTPCAPDKQTDEKLAIIGATPLRRKKNLRTWARASRALRGTCETWAHARAPGERLATTGATHVRSDENLRPWACASRDL